MYRQCRGLDAFLPTMWRTFAASDGFIGSLVCRVIFSHRSEGASRHRRVLQDIHVQWSTRSTRSTRSTQTCNAVSAWTLCMEKIKTCVEHCQQSALTRHSRHIRIIIQYIYIIWYAVHMISCSFRPSLNHGYCSHGYSFLQFTTPFIPSTEQMVCYIYVW